MCFRATGSSFGPKAGSQFPAGSIASALQARCCAWAGLALAFSPGPPGGRRHGQRPADLSQGSQFPNPVQSECRQQGPGQGAASSGFRGSGIPLAGDQQDISGPSDVHVPVVARRRILVCGPDADDWTARSSPSLDSTIEPNLKVVVDTFPPSLLLEPDERRGSLASVRWEVKDENLDLEVAGARIPGGRERARGGGCRFAGRS